MIKVNMLIFLCSLPCMVQAMNANLLPGVDQGLQKQMNNEEGLKKAWGKVKMVQSFAKKSGASQFLNQAYAEAEADMTYFKKRLPEGRGDEIIKQLEENWQK